MGILSFYSSIITYSEKSKFKSLNVALLGLGTLLSSSTPDFLEEKCVEISDKF
jgi:hypothetical protein